MLKVKNKYAYFVDRKILHCIKILIDHSIRLMGIFVTKTNHNVLGQSVQNIVICILIETGNMVLLSL